jgi:acyl carrier protein
MGLDTVELVVAIEDSCAVKIPNAAAETLFTPRDVIAFMVERIKERPGDQIRPLVAEIVRLQTINQLGLKPKEYREDARFVEDFGAD